MTQSKQELPHFYVTTEVDAEPMLTMRAQINPALPEGEKLSVNDFIVKATALALREFPNLNASLDGDQIHRHGSINVGIAVSVEDGLLTVVTRDSDLKPLRQLSIETRTMVERTRSGKVRPDDIEGSTFTVSNLGMFDVDHFIAIINPPEAAILAIGSVNEVPVVKDGLIVPGKRMKVTLSADHRVTDGAEVAQWLVVFKRYIEQPALLLI
jgi:pyruvate dehydrogenase E2 component (dihydrolipoamide acetyltransferase)